MCSDARQRNDDSDPRFRIFYELMQRKVRDILLVSTLYDACIMEEDGRLVERIINEYRGLNLSQPPRINWASTAEEALELLDKKKIDLVITMLRLADMDAYALAERIREKVPDLPILLLSHTVPDPHCVPETVPRVIDRTFVWTGNADLLLALIKSTEDRWNVVPDTQSAGVRVILFVEDSPLYRSTLLPVLYKEVVSQIQAVMEEGLNEEHKLLTMRARPKILVAETFEEAVELFKRFEPFVLGVISDVRFPLECRMDDSAGVRFLKEIKRERFDIPLLLTSSDPVNALRASEIPAVFLNKNSATLHDEIRAFLKLHLGFGSFIFRMPDGREITRVSNIRSLERVLPSIPIESFHHHWTHNDFSRWLFARTEIILASKLRPVTDADFKGDEEAMRQFLVTMLRKRRRWQQLAVVATLEAEDFDAEMEFFRVGKGSLGGKGRGLVFLFNLLRMKRSLHENFPQLNIVLPQTLIVTTEGFESFMQANSLKEQVKGDLSDEEIGKIFLRADFPEWLEKRLATYLSKVDYPLAVRSSSILEDSHSRPYAGLYKTYMLPNNHPRFERRLEQMVTAIKLVYASTFYGGPRSYASRTPYGVEEDKMAVVIQRLVGRSYEGHFYPAVSGVAQSYNYYPFPPMKPEDGIAHIALGLGRTVVEGGRTVRFSPRYPKVLPGFSTVEEILAGSQGEFYSLDLQQPEVVLEVREEATLERRHIMDAAGEEPVLLLSDTYVPEEHRIREGTGVPGTRVLTFSNILKYGAVPLADVLSELLPMGRTGMGCPVEIEFSVNLHKPDEKERHELALLQIRPMAHQEHYGEVEIRDDEIDQAFCYSVHALGNGVKEHVEDILFVIPERFDVAQTREMAREIGSLNAKLQEEKRRYLLIGPGRWGSADRWLGIPVDWRDISGVEAIVEVSAQQLKVEPSQGSHFFHNITSLGIDYVMVTENGEDFLDWDWLKAQPRIGGTPHVAHVRLQRPFVVKVEGKQSRCVMLKRV